MKICLLLILFSFTSITFSQKNADEPINIRCEHPIKDGYHTRKFLNEKSNCYFIEKGNMKDSRKVGTWIKFKCDTIHPYLIGNFENGRPNGSYSRYFEGKLIEKGTFSKKQYIDSLSRYHSNGTPSFKAFFKDSNATNYSGSYYNTEGKLELSYVVENGKVVQEKIVQSIKDNLIPYNYLNTKDTIYIYPSSLFEKHIPFDMNDLNRFEKNIYSDEQFIYYNKNHDPFLIGWLDENYQFNGKKFIYSNEGYLLEIKLYVNGFLFSSEINLNPVEKVPSENFNLSSKKKNKS